MKDAPLRFDGGMKIDSDGHRPRPCRHRAVRLEVEDRNVVCRGCGKILDPFETLLMFADAGARQVRRHEDAETAEEAIRDLVAKKGQVTISKRGVVASVTVNGRRTQASGHSMDSLWGGVVNACGQLKRTLIWKKA